MSHPCTNQGQGSDPIGTAIMGYLAKHPDAQDTVRGIAEWWLSGQGVRCSRRALEVTLDRLVAEGWLTIRTAADGQAHYRRSAKPPPAPTVERPGADGEATSRG